MKLISPADIYQQAGGRRGLAGWTYHNSELTQLEMEQVILKNWIFIGHVSEIKNKGDYLAFDMGKERALVVRGDNEEIHAFHNVCRHRASRVVADDRGHCGNALICPFHGWSYHLDGRLKNVPFSQGFPEFDKSRFGLRSVDLEIWHGLIFVRLDGDSPSIAEQFADAEEEISLYRIEDMSVYDEPWRMDFDVDWKAVLDVDSEGYHVPVGHPELFDLVGSTYQDQLFASGLIRSSGSFADRRFKTPQVKEYVESLPQSYLPAPYDQLWTYWGAFPGFVITLFPDMVEVYQIYPTGPQSSVMAGMTCALPDDRPEMARARALNRQLNTQVGVEDMNLVKWAAEGMNTSGFEQLMLGDQESGIAFYQNRLKQLLPVVGLEQAPAEGKLREINEQMAASSL